MRIKGIRNVVRGIVLSSILLLAVVALASEQSKYQEGTLKVFLMEIRDDIDPRMNRYVDLALDQATDVGADIVLIDMDTYGGAVNDANDIRTRILEYEKPVWVYINNDAASAGALISIACDSIYMVPGANIGAATVVNGADGTQAPDKYQSYMRSIMRSTAEENNRDPLIAEGMVDDRVEIEGVTESGKIITFTTSEAIANGYCEREVASIQDILEKNNIVDYELIRYELSGTEKVISFFLNPFVSGLLILVITAGIFFELQTPGVGFPLAAAGIALVLYLVPYYLNGLAANWEIAVFFIGFALIALEVFVIPGFGVAGVAGIICTVGALIFIMLGNDNFNFDNVPVGEISTAAGVVGAGVVGSIVVLFVFGYRFTKSKMFDRVALTSSQEKADGYVATFHTQDLVGRQGTANTILRPSGRIDIDGEIYDAYTRGEYVEAGEKVVVISQEGSSLKVRAIK
ncbi:nodulation protein NfeD [Roseivirga sp. E12]|uniref:NfeD family protein n=1 Tax=Roseivirga sp. E12 TaxID=2819237 RepID=UPI00351C2C33